MVWSLGFRGGFRKLGVPFWGPPTFGNYHTGLGAGV